MFIPIVLSILFVFKYLKDKKGVIDRSLVYLMLCCSLCLISSIYYESSMGITISYLALLIFSYIYTKYFSFFCFVSIFKKLMFAQCLLSLIMWVIATFFLKIIPLPELIYYQATTGEQQIYYSFYYFVNMAQDAYGEFYRAMGAFWEPGIFQAYIIISILFEVIYPSKKTIYSIGFILIHILTLIVTFSTTGYVGFVVLILYLILANKKTVQMKWYVKFFMLFIMLVLVVLVLNNKEIYMKVFGKIDEQNGSYVSRYASWSGNIQLALQYPFMGVGYGNTAKHLNVLIAEYSRLGYIHQTNTFTNYFATWGIFIGGYFIYGWMRFCRRISKDIFSGIILFILFVVITSGENFLPSLFFNTLIFYGINWKYDMINKQL